MVASWTCYGPDADGNITPDLPNWVPCYERNSTNPYVPCCQLGSFCLSDSICAVADYQNKTAYEQPDTRDKTPFYVAACTDSEFQDPACSTNCKAFNSQQIVYNDTTKFWACCAQTYDQDVINCTMPNLDTQFRAPNPFSFGAAVTSLANFYPAEITDYAQYLTQTILTQPAALSTLLNDVLTDATTLSGGLRQVPYAVYSGFLTTGRPDALYTGPAALSATLTPGPQPGPTTTPPGPLPTASTTVQPASSGPKASVIGPAVGVPVGVLLIAGIIGVFWFMRRKRRRAATPQIAESNPPPAAQHAPPAMQQYSQGPSNYGGYPTEQKQADYYGGYTQSSPPASPPLSQTHTGPGSYYNMGPRSDTGHSPAPVQQNMWTGSTATGQAPSSQAGNTNSMASGGTQMSPVMAGPYEMPDANAFSAAEKAHELDSEAKK